MLCSINWNYWIVAPRLVSELASEGASGRLFSQTQNNKNATRFGPIYHRHVHFNLIQIRIASCLFVRTSRKCVTPKTWPTFDQLFGHLQQTRPFWARTFGPKTRVTIVTDPKLDQLFGPSAADTSILCSILGWFWGPDYPIRCIFLTENYC